MRHDLHFKIITHLIFMVLFMGVIWGNIQGSAHDFSSRGWSNGEICLPCHTPHSANTIVMEAPLWNHEVTTATYTVYSSPTMIGTALAPRGMSKLCLSCHDGTVAVDSFGGMTGAEMVNGAALIGTSLADDHPISIYWSHQNELQNGTCVKCHNPRPTDFNPILPLFDRYIECATCHDVHNKTNNVKLLRKPLLNSEICLHCHGK
jgi:predicted CXXCH cytochrome family protein